MARFKFFKPLGWSMGMNRWRDETGMFHLSVLDAGAIQCRNACGTNSLVSGGIETDIERRGQRCQTCVRAAVKLFGSIDDWTAEQCNDTMRSLNGESRHLEEIENNLDYYREHCRHLVRDHAGLDNADLAHLIG